MVMTITMLYVGFNYLRGIDFFENTNKYYAKYENVGGLTKSNAVTISGYPVGRVSNVTIVQSDNHKVIVEMTINGDIVLGKGAKAILDVGLLGETALIVEPGDISQLMSPGDTLESELGAGVEEIVKNTVEPVAATIQSTIVRVNAILDKLAGSGDQIKAMVDNLESTTRGSKMLVQELRTDIAQMVGSYNEVIGNINGKIDELTPVINKYGELADTLKAIDSKPTLLAAENTMQNIDSLLQKIQSSEGTFNAILEDRSLYDNLNGAVLTLDSMLQHMQSRPKDFFAPLGRDKPKGPRKK